MKKIALLSLCILAIGVVLYWWLGRGKAEAAEYRVEPAQRGELLVAISATGTLNALTTVQVGSQVSGTISKLYADFNSQVKEGQLLALLDPTFMQASVNEQRANVDRAKSQVNDAQRNFNRTKELFDKQFVSQADMDAATTALESAQASLRQAQASLDRAEVNLRYTVIRAPISGVVISRNVDVGQTVAASLQAPTLFTIAEDLSRMQVQASIDEADIGNVQIGQHVGFRVDAYADREFEGTVSQIRLAPVVSQNVVTYNVVIDVANPDLKLMPGMTATVSIEVSKKENVLRVPLQALRFTPPGMDPRDAFKNMRGGQRDQRQTGEQRDSSGQRASRQQSGESSGETGQGRRAQATGDVRAAPNPQNSGSRPDSTSRGVVWILKSGKPQPLPVVRGMQNTRYAEVVRSPLQEGDSVIVGLASSAQTTAAPQGQNPFMPRMPGGGGGRR